MAPKTVIVVLTVLCLTLLQGCGPKVMPPAQLNSPEYHVKNGNTLIKSGKLQDAFAEFKWAQGLDPTYSPAYTGMGLVYGLQGEFEKGLSTLAPAMEYARTDAQKIDVHVGYMRFYLTGQDRIDPDWLWIVHQHYEKAVTIDPKSPRPYFYMGQAYIPALEFPSALAEFRRVIDLNKNYREDAEREYKNLKRIEAAGPKTEVGRKIAIQRTITRADAAALLMAELPFDEKFRQHAAGLPNHRQPRPSAKDIANHPFMADINAVIALDLNGLKQFSDNSFRPDLPMTRANFAMAIEDLLIRVTRDEKLATRFVGAPSPFPDLRNDRAYFNAVMVVTERDMMGNVNSQTNNFEPMEPISGVDALSTVHSFRTFLEQG